MRIVIAGQDEVALRLAEALQHEHALTLIVPDTMDDQRLPRLDVRVLRGRMTSSRVLREAGVEEADCRAETLGGAFAVVVGAGRRRGGVDSTGSLASDVSFPATVRGELAARLAGVGVTAAAAISPAALGGVEACCVTDPAAADGAGDSPGVERETTEGEFDAAIESSATGIMIGTGSAGDRESAWACSEGKPPVSLPSYVSGRLGRRTFANLESVGATRVGESAVRSLVARGEAIPANPSPARRASTFGADPGSEPIATTSGIGSGSSPADMIV